jgi:tetratricopeptide (TPR) repeat protein
MTRIDRLPDTCPASSDDAAPAVASAYAPFDRALRVLAGGLLVVVLIAALSLVLYSRTIEAPRTVAERDIMTYRTAVAEDPSTLANHLRLSAAYSSAGRHAEALETVRRARALSEAAIVELTEADALRRSGAPEESLPLYGSAIDKGIAEYDATIEDLRRRRVSFEPPNTLLVQALLGRGAALAELGRAEDALADVEEAALVLPTDASVLATLGDYRAAVGDSDGAAEAYRAALRFVADLPQAREGLARLELGSP